MNEKQKVEKILKSILSRGEELERKQHFCQEHHFNLEARKFDAMKTELRRVARLIERVFDIN